MPRITVTLDITDLQQAQLDQLNAEINAGLPKGAALHSRQTFALAVLEKGFTPALEAAIDVAHKAKKKASAKD